MAQQASSTAEVLAHAQAESITGVCQELFCSPEIVRQGGMQQWSPSNSAWLECHFVLTRCAAGGLAGRPLVVAAPHDASVRCS